MQQSRLSKSRITSFRQCPKRLWLEVNRPKLTEVTAQMQAAFDTGHCVGEIAQRAYPDGILIAPDNNLARALADTRAALPLGKPLFEATFQNEGVLIRADLLLPVEDAWHMAEVKSTTGVKNYHHQDVATQVWVVQGQGLRIGAMSVRHIDRDFTLQTPGDFAGLLMDADVSEPVQDLLPGLPQIVQQARATLAGGEPAITTGPHCSDPFECPFQAYCVGQQAPGPEYPVTLLPGIRGKRIARELMAEGLLDLQQVQQDQLSDPQLQRIQIATATDIPYLDSAGARSVMSKWSWPRYFLDFETIAHAVPVWLGTHPYEAIPFQFSCHLQTEGGDLTHTGFLDLSGENPSRACALALLSAIGPVGAVVAYNASFERQCIRRLAGRLPDLAPVLLSIEQRLADLLPVVRNHYYHRDMRGSYSIKTVLPVLVPHLGYGDLGEVQDGNQAQLAYLEATAPGCDAQRRQVLASELEAYCRLDTLAMVELARALT